MTSESLLLNRISTGVGHIMLETKDPAMATHVAIPVDSARGLLEMADKYGEVVEAHSTLRGIVRALRQETGL